MNQLALLTTEGKDFNLNTYLYNEKPCWIAQEVGNLLGYGKEGRKILDLIRDDWGEELIRNHDYKILKGQELVDFKKILKGGTDSGAPFLYSNMITILFESGINFCLVKTNKPVGRKLRRFIIDEVLPQIARTGEYRPRTKAFEPSIESFEEKKFKYQVMISLLEHLEQADIHSPEVLTAHRVVAVERITGMNLDTLKPENTKADWKSPTEIANQLGITAQRVGLVISSLKLRGDPVYSKAIINQARHNHKTVTTYLYSPEAIKKITWEVVKLISKGKIKSTETLVA